QIRAAGREEAGVQPTFRGQARARAGPAERLRHAGDEADLAAAVAITPAFGHLAAVVGRDRFDRQDRVDPRGDLAAADDLVELPAVGGADIHEFDEPQDMTGAAKAPGHRFDLVVVDAFLDDHV